MGCGSFFFNDTATTEIYTLSLHDALPIWGLGRAEARARRALAEGATGPPGVHAASHAESVARDRTPVRHERGWRRTATGRGGARTARTKGHRDRKSVVEGKSVDLGGRRIIKKKTQS